MFASSACAIISVAFGPMRHRDIFSWRMLVLSFSAAARRHPECSPMTLPERSRSSSEVLPPMTFAKARVEITFSLSTASAGVLLRRVMSNQNCNATGRMGRMGRIGRGVGGGLANCVAEYSVA